MRATPDILRSSLLIATLFAASCASSPPAQSNTTPVESEAQASALPADGVDYACSADSDCVVKNLGSCCGYNPRCMNGRSQPVPEQCGEGMVGTCGFPEITHCDCYENKCVSMQNDRPLN